MYLSDEAKEEAVNINPRTYWAVKGKKEFVTLAPLASRLFEIPTFNCSSERNWKKFKSIHSKKRNRLTTKRVNDLVFVEANAFFLDEEDENDYSV